MEKVRQEMEKVGIITMQDENPNKLFLAFDMGGTQFGMMLQYNEDAEMMLIMSEIPVDFVVEKEESAFLASAYINRTLNCGSATYLPDINRMVFKFYVHMTEEYLDLKMFFDCYYEAIDLVRRYYPVIDLLDKGAILPSEVVEMEKENFAE